MPTQKMQQRRDTTANWSSANPVLAAGEIGFESSVNKFKIGNGTAAWNSLAYAGGSTNASDLTSGTLADARLSSNVPLKNATNIFSAAQTFTSSIVGEGSLTFRPPSSITPASNGDLTFERTSNTSVTIKLKGTDGVVRSVSLTLS